MTIIFDPQINPASTDVLIVGLGGTGSALARHVCRTIFHMRAAGMQTPRSIKFIDPDIVESKNLGRQMFTAGDLGQHKAEVLAKRFSMALGLQVEWYNEKYNPSKHLDQNSSYSDSTILLGCVDNHLARRDLARKSTVWIDCGNHHNSGQVIIGNVADKSAWQMHIRSATKTKVMKKTDFVAGGVQALKTKDELWKQLPNAALVFPSLLEPESVKENTPILSCAELIATGEQHLLVNDQVAIVAANYFYRLMMRQSISTFMTYIDGDSLSMRSIPITRDDLEAYVGAA